MLQKTLSFACALTAAFAAAAYAQAQSSTFQNSCSNIKFDYFNNQHPKLGAVCLRTDGTVNPTSLILKGISNDDGTLKKSGADSSTFQQSCGNIQIDVAADGSQVSLTALCRTSAGAYKPASLELTGITNNNGILTGG